MTTPGALMRSEILQQPTVLRNLLASARPVLQRLMAQVADRNPAFAMLAARGSSDNASTYGKYLFESQLGLPTALAAPSLFTLYHAVPRLANALVIGVSQSGGSVDVVQVVRSARAQGALTLGMTNTANSDLHHEAGHTVLLEAGAERALAATKTVTAQCLAYAMMALAGDASGALGAIPAEVERALAHEPAISALVNRWMNVERCAIVGRGFTYSAAQETALKLKETCFISAEPYSGADFMHGPLALVEPGYLMLVLVNSDATLTTTLALIDRARERGAVLTVWANGEEASAALTERGAPADVVISASALTSNISLIVLGQLFALNLSIARGHNPDVSRGLSKITITR